MAFQIKLVETIRGEGRLSWGESTYKVSYVIHVRQKFNESVPLGKTATGHLFLNQGDLEFGMLRAMLDLKLQDGRLAKIFLTDVSGNFEVTGPIDVPPKDS